MYHGNIAATFARRLRAIRVPVIWNIRQSLYDLSMEKRLTRSIIRLGATWSHYATRIVYNSRVSAAQHESIGYSAQRACLIPNGFDATQYRPDPAAGPRLRAKLGLSAGTVLIGHIARYHPMKDHENLLRAASALVGQGKDICLIMAGQDIDPNNRGLARLIGELGLQGKVRLLGERSDIPQLNAALDIAISASAWGEGFPNVIGEAMASATPCVVTDVGDSAAIVGDAGIVVPARDYVALGQACRQLIDLGPDARCAMGFAARRRVVQCFSLASTAQRYQDLYRCAIEFPNDALCVG
jgi:glycosyltransferase involved in cell wall biosynthesis